MLFDIVLNLQYDVGHSMTPSSEGERGGPQVAGLHDVAELARRQQMMLFMMFRGNR
jgi:hypothetical protein